MKRALLVLLISFCINTPSIINGQGVPVSFTGINLGNGSVCFEWFRGGYDGVQTLSGPGVTQITTVYPIPSNPVLARYFCGSCGSAFIYDQHEVIFGNPGPNVDVMVASCSVG